MKSYNNKNIKDTKIINNFLKKFSYLGDKVFSNYTHGTSNKIDRFDYLKSSKLFNIFDFNIGNGICGEKNIDIYEHNNEWLSCCNLPEGVCFDGKDIRDSTKKESIIEEYKKVGWKFTHEDNCELFFERVVPPIPNDTDIHAYFDNTSMLISDAIVAKAALISWFEGIKAAYPSYTGNLYIISIEFSDETGPEVFNSTERRLRSIEYSHRGTPTVIWSTPSPWEAIQVLPPNFADTSLYVPPDNLIILSFVDEVKGAFSASEVAYAKWGYHGVYMNFGESIDIPSGTWNNPQQPTEGYLDDLAMFLSLKPTFTSFKQVLYPIKRDSGECKANVLQMAAALTGSIITPTELAELNASEDLSILLTRNPYTVPLKDHGFLGILDKVSPAVDVFTSSTFASELNGLLKFNKPVYQYTSVKYPIKKLKPKEVEIDNKWNLTFVKNNHCLELTDSYLSNLYKISLK